MPRRGSGRTSCDKCKFEYEFSENFLSYNCDALLHERFRKKFLLYKALNNNGYLSYHFLKEGSLSLSGRQDVRRFREFVLSHMTGGRLLDVGCGILSLPGYLDFPDKSAFELVGLDPIYDRSFQGLRVVGCSEFTPFPSGSFDALVYATSLDHVCCLEQTLAEAYRILKPGGKIFVWMSDRRRNLRERIGEIIDSWRRWGARQTNTRGYCEGRYVVFPNYTVLYVPKGAVDPFHSCLESPDDITRRLAKHDLALRAEMCNSKDEVFLCFGK